MKYPIQLGLIHTRNELNPIVPDEPTSSAPKSTAPLSRSSPNGDFGEKSVPLWRRLLTETLLITLGGAVLFIWGRIYYTAFADQLGLAVSTVQISVYETMFASWQWAALSVMLVLLARCAWIFGPIFAAILVILVRLPFALAILGLQKLPSRHMQAGWAVTFGRQLVTGIRWLIALVPEPLQADVGKIDETQLPSILVYCFTVGILTLGCTLSAEAGKRAAVQSSAHHDRPVTLVFRDKAEVHGFFIAAFGDAVVIDEDVGQSTKRRQAKTTDLLSIIRDPLISDVGHDKKRVVTSN